MKALARRMVLVRGGRRRARGGWHVLGGALAALSLMVATQAPAAGAESAVWVKKKINFVYQGFTTHYSCYGLQDTMRDVLLQLGARKSDMNVHATGCTSPLGHPDPFPGVAGTFYVLEPASTANAPQGAGGAAAESGSATSESAPATTENGKKGADERTVKAQWRTVDVRVGRPGLDQAGQCELVDQVRERVLPLFSARDVKFTSNCFPHQLILGGSTLRVQVLKPAAAGSHDVAEAAH